MAALGRAGSGEGTERRKTRRHARREADGGVGAGSKKEQDSGQEEEAEGASRDPLVVLGPDIMTKILESSDACSVARCALVSLGWYEIAASNHLWGPKYEELLKGKAHIPQLSNSRRSSRLAAYSMSIMDGKRTRIMKEDLCDHIWIFHFQKAAPEYWRNLDPSWNGTGPPMHRYFHPNGSHAADPEDEVWGGHECQYSIMTSYVGGGQIRDHYVRINRWPPMTVSRKEDWSWEMSNNLYCYNSVPDAEKEGGSGPLFPVW